MLSIRVIAVADEKRDSLVMSLLSLPIVLAADLPLHQLRNGLIINSAIRRPLSAAAIACKLKRLLY